MPSSQSGFLRALGTVFGAFIGIRKRRSQEADASLVKPQHVIVAGVILAIVFISMILFVVRFITRN